MEAWKNDFEAKFVAQAERRFRTYLQEHAPYGDWVPKRELFKHTCSFKVEPIIYEWALHMLTVKGVIEIAGADEQTAVRLAGRTKIPASPLA